MKYILLLTLAMACSTKDKTTTQTENVESPESEARPVSPYTVKPCYCQKIFMPVCAGGNNYSNSCEAECNGHKTWTEGNCSKTPKK
jgi:hypothetical protein